MTALSVKEKLVVGEVSVPLYVTFDSQEEALQDISSNLVIGTIMEMYGYSPISDDNWKLYYDAMYELMDSPLRPEWYNEGNTEFRQLRQFFDIYENKEKNDVIKSTILTSAISGGITPNIDVMSLLPYESYNTLNAVNTGISVASVVVNGFNVDNGVAYAKKYAETANKSVYGTKSKDCTNFVSQILENGGIAQVKYSDEAKGWWHTTSSVHGSTFHKYSISWVNADTFSRYMGVHYTSTSLYNFSKNLQRGDFIAADFDNDGDWDHMGFVVDRDSTTTNGYYDFKVAQHTDNYLAWATSDKNNWDQIARDGGKYGRIRR